MLSRTRAARSVIVRRPSFSSSARIFRSVASMEIILLQIAGYPAIFSNVVGWPGRLCLAYRPVTGLPVGAEKLFTWRPGYPLQGLLEVDRRALLPVAGQLQVFHDRIHDLQAAAMLVGQRYRAVGGRHRRGPGAAVHHLDHASPAPGADRHPVLLAGPGMHDDVG